MLLTGHKSRAIFDRYNIIHEQELLEAGDQLVAYLAQQAQQAQAVPARQRPHPAGPATPRTAPPLRLVRRTTAQGHAVRPRAGRRGPDTACLCAAGRVEAQSTGRPAIVAHVATGRADAAEHGHAPDPTEPPGQEARRPRCSSRRYAI